MDETFVCGRCGNECDVDYDYGDLICICDECEQEALGFNPEIYESNYYCCAMTESFNEREEIKLENS